MRVSLYEAKFGVDLTIQQIGLIVEALITYAEKEMDGEHLRLAKQRLELAKELRDSMAADLEQQKRSYLEVQIKTRLDALED
tara:strand:- start:473 stop:718 length:246 start_codon:yes stop_codon:yes gene_type:complete